MHNVINVHVRVFRRTCSARPLSWSVWSSATSLSNCRTTSCRSTSWRTESRFFTQTHKRTDMSQCDCWQQKSVEPVSDEFHFLQVLHTDVCLQNVLLQNTDVLIMNNVFEFFMEPSEQVRSGSTLTHTLIENPVRHTGCHQQPISREVLKPPGVLVEGVKQPLLLDGRASFRCDCKHRG